MVKNPPSIAGDMSLGPSQRAKIPHAPGPKNKNIKQKQYCNKFNKDFKNGPHQKKKKKFKKGKGDPDFQKRWRNKRKNLSHRLPSSN